VNLTVFTRSFGPVTGPAKDLVFVLREPLAFDPDVEVVASQVSSVTSDRNDVVDREVHL